MSTDPSPPDPELARFFDAEREYEEQPTPEARARIMAALGVAAPGGGGGAAGGAGGAPAAPGAVSMSVSKAIAGMLATFVVGGFVGAAVMRRLEPLAPVASPSASASAVVVAPAPATATPVLPLAEPSAEPLAPPAPPAALANPPNQTEDARGAAAERALLDAARIALGAGDPEQALAVTARHAREYPRGRFAEEREAIAVRALVKAGHYDAARARAARFQALYPGSVAAPAVSAAIHSIP